MSPRLRAGHFTAPLLLLVPGTPAFAGDPQAPGPPALVETLVADAPSLGDELGRSVAYREPFMVAGAWGASSGGTAWHGSASVWRWTPSGWISEGTLLASDHASGDRFGGAVAIARPAFLSLPRSAIVVGAQGADIGEHADAGAAYVFRRSLSGTWTEETKLVASDPQANAQFGRAIAMDGDLLAIAAPHRNNFRGAVYLFRMRVDDNGDALWTQEAVLQSGDLFAGDTFGASVAVAGDTVVVGAPGADIGLSVNQGAAYVFRQTGLAWQQVAKLVAPGGQMLDELGRAVAIDDDATTIAVATSPTFSTQLGRVDLFKRLGNAWMFDDSVASPDPQAGEQFGASISVHRDLLAVGAPARSVADQPLRGAVTLFERATDGWLWHATLVDERGAAGDSFGSAVTLSGEAGIFGARGVDHDGAANAGAVTIAWVLDCDGDASLGMCNPPVGDLNGDGVINGSDLGTLLGWWGPVEPWSPGDLNGDGWVDGDDLGSLLGQWN